MPYSSAKMTRAQRIFLAIAIVFLAWMLHFSLCEWHWRENVNFIGLGGQRVLYSLWSWYRQDPATGAYSLTGLTTREFVDRTAAVVLGVIVPLAMIIGDVWWMLGWRRQSRLAMGRCVSCGYDLKGSSSPQCPECATPRTARPV